MRFPQQAWDLIQPTHWFTGSALLGRQKFWIGESLCLAATLPCVLDTNSPSTRANKVSNTPPVTCSAASTERRMQELRYRFVFLRLSQAAYLMNTVYNTLPLPSVQWAMTCNEGKELKFHLGLEQNRAALLAPTYNYSRAIIADISFCLRGCVSLHNWPISRYHKKRIRTWSFLMHNKQWWLIPSHEKKFWKWWYK